MTSQGKVKKILLRLFLVSMGLLVAMYALTVAGDMINEASTVENAAGFVLVSIVLCAGFWIGWDFCTYLVSILRAKPDQGGQG